MSPEGWAALGGIGVAVVTSVTSLRMSLMNRPKVNAEATAASATGETTISADARAWAEDFREETREAKAEVKALSARMDAAEDTIDGLVSYVRILQGEVIALGGHPSPPPEHLIPPLTRT